MNDKFIRAKQLRWLGWLSAINFNIAVMVLLAVSLLSAAGNSLIFDNNNELYGPLAGNLRLMMVYLTLSQFAAYCFCSYSDNYRALLPIGLFWLLLVGLIDVYGIINQIPIDEDYGYFFLYLGLSNLIYGGTMVVGGGRERDSD